MAGTSRREQRDAARGLAIAARQVSEVVASIVDSAEIEGILAASGVRVVNTVRRSMKATSLQANPRTSASGNRRAARARHRPSKPGEAPAIDTARLSQSYTWRTGRNRKGYFVEVGSNVKYAPMLEFGTRRMRPRPALRPAINLELSHIQAVGVAELVKQQRAKIARLPKVIEL